MVKVIFAGSAPEFQNKLTEAIIKSGMGIYSNLELLFHALQHKISYATTIAAAEAICDALEHAEEQQVYKLQYLHQELTL